MHPHPERIFCHLALYKSSFICYNSQALKVYAPVAQWIEHRIPVPRVGGSSPFWRTKNRTSHSGCPVFAYAKGLEQLNAAVRWTAAKRRLDGVCSIMSRVPSGVPPDDLILARGRVPCGTARAVRWTAAKRRLDGVCSIMSRVPSGVPRVQKPKINISYKSVLCFRHRPQKQPAFRCLQNR